jgi:glycosyltransferase involved in cell wall biosynthesis
MPAWNAAAYIGQALDSLLAQTFTDWECVVVDDCSTDRTAEIVGEYSERDPRIIRHTLSHNSGSAKLPRDTAIGLARGEWIMALDADDTLAPETIGRLVDRQRETGADFVALRMVSCDRDLKPVGETTPERDFDMAQVMDGKQAVMLTIGRWVIGANGALIDRGLWNGREKGHHHMNADEYDTRQMLLNSRRVAFADTPYYYRRNPESVSRKISHKIFEPLITDRLVADLVAEHFGAGSPQHRVAETFFLDGLLKQHYIYSERGKELDHEERGRARRLIAGAKRVATPKKVLASRLPWEKKAVLILPSAMISALARVIIGSKLTHALKRLK